MIRVIVSTLPTPLQNFVLGGSKKSKHCRCPNVNAIDNDDDDDGGGDGDDDDDDGDDDDDDDDDDNDDDDNDDGNDDDGNDGNDGNDDDDGNDDSKYLVLMDVHISMLILLTLSLFSKTGYIHRHHFSYN